MNPLDFIEKYQNSISTILQIITLIVIPILLTRINDSFQRRNKLEENSFNDKKKVFDDFIEALYILFDTNKDETQKVKEYNDKMASVRKKLITIASLDTLKAFNKWSEYAEENKLRNTEAIKTFDRILYYLRKDLGISDESVYQSFILKFSKIIVKFFRFEYFHPIATYDRFQFLWGTNLGLKKQQRFVNIFAFIIAVPLTPILIPFIIIYKVFKQIYLKIFKPIKFKLLK